MRVFLGVSPEPCCSLLRKVRFSPVVQAPQRYWPQVGQYHRWYCGYHIMGRPHTGHAAGTGGVCMGAYPGMEAAVMPPPTGWLSRMTRYRTMTITEPTVVPMNVA